MLRSRFTTHALVLAALTAACSSRDDISAVRHAPNDVAASGRGPSNPANIDDGQSIFRFDTFGDETFWTDTLRMHEVIRSGVSPMTALGVGLKVDADALPAEVKAKIVDKTLDLNSPATTVALLKLGAVVGVIGEVDANN